MFFEVRPTSLSFIDGDDDIDIGGDEGEQGEDEEGQHEVEDHEGDESVFSPLPGF